MAGYQPNKEKEALLQGKPRFRAAFENAAIGMAIVAPDGVCLEANDALCQVLGYSRGELEVASLNTLTHPEDLNTDADSLHQMVDGDLASYQIDKRYRHKQGRFIWGLLTVSVVRDTSGKPLYFICQLLDITQRKQIEAGLRDLAMRDEMTGLYNRRGMLHLLKSEVDRCRRYGRFLALVALDIDSFKQINDTHGHHAGDEVLRQLSNLLISEIRPMDKAARWGGEELAILLPETTDSGALKIAEHLRVLIAAHTFVDSQQNGHDFRIQVTVSLGIACLPSDAESVHGLVNAADHALYQAKNEGRNCTVLFGKSSLRTDLLPDY